MPALQYVFKYLIKLIQPVKAGLAFRLKIVMSLASEMRNGKSLVNWLLGISERV